jgi:DNA-binding MarR family transcriptional regulator
MSSTTSTSRRRSPHAEELRVWRDFIETSERLRAALEARLQSDSGLSSGDYAVLLGLSEADGNRLRSSTLADQIHWERSRLSHHLARMEARGLVSREKCLTDNRGAEIMLTAAGARQFRRASGPHLHAIQEIFVDALTPELLDSVDTINGALKDALDAREQPA